MKTFPIVLSALGLAAGAWFLLSARSTNQKTGVGQANASVSEVVATAPTAGATAEEPAVPDTGAARLEEISPPDRRPAASQIAPVRNATALPVQQALATLISGEATFAQKQAAWNQIKDAGKMDEVITELEQRSVANPNSPEYPATLGQAYLQKAGMLKDIREQGILGMKADQSFDAALNLDSSNWEAGFWKATAMSYWPPQLGKGQEVIGRFVNLVKLQETQTTQPQFAQTYLQLGDQYQKQGYPDYARQTWQRGGTLFPIDARFNEKIVQSQAAQTVSR